MFKSKTDNPPPTVDYKALHADLERKMVELIEEIDDDRRQLNEIGLTAVSPNATPQQIEALAEGQAALKAKGQRLEELRPLVDAAHRKALQADEAEARKRDRAAWAAFDKVAKGRWVGATRKMDRGLDQFIAGWQEIAAASKEAIEIAPCTKFAGDGSGVRINYDMQPGMFVEVIKRRLGEAGVLPKLLGQGPMTLTEVAERIRERILFAAGIVEDQSAE